MPAACKREHLLLLLSNTWWPELTNQHLFQGTWLTESSETTCDPEILAFRESVAEAALALIRSSFARNRISIQLRN